MQDTQTQTGSPIGKPADEFRNYAAEARDTVKEFYRLNHTHQTLDFVLDKKRDYLALNRKRMKVWEALEFLDTLVDDSDPDVDFTQIEHALQTAEAARKSNQPRWMIVTALIHDLGKMLCVYGEPQWAVVGDTHAVGCKFSDKCVYPEFFADNPDSTHPVYSTDNGIYEPGCGLDNIHLSWGHDEYVYHVVKDHLPHGGAVRAAVPLVLPVAQGRRLQPPRQRHRPRDDEVGEGVQPLRPVFEGRRAAGREGAAAVLRGVGGGVLPRTLELVVRSRRCRPARPRTAHA